MTIVFCAGSKQQHRCRSLTHLRTLLSNAGGLTLSRAIGDFGVGEAVLPLPHVKQVGCAKEHASAGRQLLVVLQACGWPGSSAKRFQHLTHPPCCYASQVLLPPSGGRLVLASDGVWSQAGERLLHTLRRAPIRSAAMEVVRVATGSGGSSVDASVVVADVLEPGDTWQAMLQRQHGVLGVDAAKPKGAAAGQRTLGLLRKLSLGRCGAGRAGLPPYARHDLLLI